MQSRLALFLLGPPHIERDGLPVKLDRRKAIALLAFLAVTGEAHRRDALVNLLWPEYDGSRGRAALRRTLYALRKALDGAWLQVDRQEIGLDPSAGLWVDVDQFHGRLAACTTHGHPSEEACPACLAPLTEAVALVRGDFMSGFGLKDSLNFDDWQILQAEVLRRELAGALERLIDWHAARHEFDAAAGHARRRLQTDPLDEPAHRQLMRLYTWSGQRSSALRQFEECSQLLKEQLGVPPEEETTALFRDIQAGRAPAAPAAPVAAGQAKKQPRATHQPPIHHRAVEPPSFVEADQPVEMPIFVARGHELAVLDRLLDLTMAGQGRVAFVSGEAGQGKTALLHEFSRRAQEAHTGLIVANGNCNAHTGIGNPYLPFREILGLLTGDVEAPLAAGAMTREQARRLWQLLPLTVQALIEEGPDLIDTFVPGSALLSRAAAFEQSDPDWLAHIKHQAEQTQASGRSQLKTQREYLFEQYARVLQALAYRLPLVLMVDDLQWADLGSVSLLFHLGRQLAGSSILILGAYRPEQVTIGSDGDRHPLGPVVNEFQRIYGKVTVDLTQSESRGFVAAILDSEPNRLDTPFREMLHRQTLGHPLFTVELLRGLQERGDFDP